MVALDIARKEFLTALKKAVGKSFAISTDMLATPPQPEYGDISFPCFALAKGMGRNPAEIAVELAAKMAPGGMIKGIIAVGPYVNARLDDGVFADRVLEDIRKRGKRYGEQTTGRGKRVLLEYANPNTHKELHVGHLRNIAYGLAAINLLRANGYEVTPVSYINDLGNNVAKCLWGLLHLAPDEDPAPGDRLNFLGRIYAMAVREIGEDPEKLAEVSKIQRDLEEMEGDIVPLWKKTQAWSLEGIRAAFAEFDLPIAHTYLEHEIIEEAQQTVKRLLTDGIAKMSQGAVIVDLEDEGLGVNLLKKTDGALLYNAKDLALAARKEEDYHADRSLYVIDARQSLAMQHLFATLRRMGFSKDLVHLSYDLVTLPEGVMSSRKGNIVGWDDLRTQLMEQFTAMTKERHPRWRARRIDANARALTRAAILFGMSRQDPNRPITFTTAEIAAVDGATGPYLLYAIARMARLREKAPVRPAPHGAALTDPHERTLVRMLAGYPDAVRRAGADCNPAHIAQTVLPLAQEFAAYYETVRILDDEDRTRMAARLALLDAVRQTVHNALALLGIPSIKEM